MVQSAEDLAFENGAAEAAHAANDVDMGKATSSMYALMRAGLVPDATAQGSVEALFPSTVWLPEDGTRRQCLVAIYSRAVGVYWEKGAFKKVVHKRLIDRAIITGGEVGPGPEAATRNADVLTITSSEEPCRLAMPKNNRPFQLWVLKQLGPSEAASQPGVNTSRAATAYPEAAAASDAQLPAAMWAGDPKRRYELRYWDGTTWTEHVATNGVTSTDPLDD